MTRKMLEGGEAGILLGSYIHANIIRQVGSVRRIS